MLCLLIKAGADLHAVDSEGKTAAQLASVIASPHAARGRCQGCRLRPTYSS
jgi:hypothetical protein